MKTKVLKTYFQSCDEYENGEKQKSRSFNLCLDAKNDPNSTLNSFNVFLNLRKRSTMLICYFPSIDLHHIIRIL